MPARSPPADTAGNADVKPPLSTSATLGNSASSRSVAVSHTRVGSLPQPTETNRRSGSLPMPMSQASAIGVELQRRYGGVAFQTRAVPSDEAPTTRDFVSNRATRTAFLGPSSIATGIP